MGNAVIILAGGLSSRFGQEKCLKVLGGKPLVFHVLDRVSSVVDERLIVVGSEGQRDAFTRFSSLRAGVVVDKYSDHSPLVGALTGFESVRADRALLLPCDAAFVVPEIAALLLDLCVGRSAVVPRWPNGYVEPLQAAYDAKLACEAARKALDEGKRDMLGMIGHLRRVRYVSTLVLRQYDEDLVTFHNINTIGDWQKAESMLKKSR